MFDGMLLFVVFCCDFLIPVDYTHIPRGYYSSTGDILGLPQLERRNTEEPTLINPLTLGAYVSNLESMILKVISSIDILIISFETSLKRMPHNFTDDKSSLVQVCGLVPLGQMTRCLASAVIPYDVHK